MKPADAEELAESGCVLFAVFVWIWIVVWACAWLDSRTPRV